MSLLILGLVVFLGVHSVSIVATGWRDRTAERLGEGAWKGLYSVASAIGLALIVWGYLVARQEPVVVWSPPTGLRHASLLLMLPVFPLLLAAYLPGRIQRAARHPMLAAVKFWALSHLLANGLLHEVLLFGAFLAWAVVDRISLKRRRPRPVPGAAAGRFNDLIVVVGGLALYVATVLWLHRAVIGVPVVGS